MRKLGTSDIEITPIGLGCWQFSENKGPAGKFWDAVSPEDTAAIVKTALDGGINWFDTAEAYGHGRSEAGLARALTVAGTADGDVVIATKWLPVGRTAGSIKKTIDTRLRYLDPFSIDLHQVHQPIGSLSRHAAQMEAMADLVDAKKIRTIGISNFSAKAMRRCADVLAARKLSLASNQMRYSLLDRSIESNGVIAAAKELGVTIIAYSPLAQGLLSGKFHDDPSLIKKRGGPRRFLPAFGRSGLAKSAPVVEELKRIANTHDATPSQVALAWLTTFHGDTVVAIPGASKPRHAEEAAASMRVELDADELERLDVASRAFL
jgi:aryl-alcohol dehydrogenase-like predicted oxidoreductase